MRDRKIETEEARRAERTEVVVVLGVHRSGTSLTARVLGALGLHLGEDLLPGRSDNPKGFFEHRGIVEQTRRLDRVLGVAPFKEGRLVPSGSVWWHGSEVSGAKDAIKSIVKEEVEKEEGVFGFKDPRSLYLLPMWQEIFEDLGYSPRYVLSLRDPADVVASMVRRGLSPERAELMWCSHMAGGLSRLAAGIDAVVHFERWFTEPVAQATELAGVLQLPAAGNAGVIEERLAGIVQPGLRHHGDSRAKGHEGGTGVAGELYERLCHYGRGEVEWQVVHATARTLSDVAGLSQSVMDELREQPARLEEELEATRRKLTAAQHQVDQLRMQERLERHDGPVEAIAPRYLAPWDANFQSIKTIVPAVRTPARRLKVCIATEDIVGPVRNGGIGTTYTHLAFLLAEAGHDTTILYLRSQHCESGDIWEWIEWYRERGVRFVPVDIPDGIASPAQRWIPPMYALYRKLQEERFDLVHVSEWHGSAYLCLLAKQQGLAFPDTVFCVKTSSPWLWNRENGLRAVSQSHELVKMYAERRSVELADLVIGGSAYLLRWMLDHGYRLPVRRTFVQPNVVKPVELPGELRSDRPAYGTRVPVREIVFFGRLEHRKGVDLFCEAINNLLEEGRVVPPVTFMGKYGARLPTYPELTVREYIYEQARDWPMEWQILNEFNQQEALSYLHGDGRLAVMPSVAENSTLTVYETTQFAIPFIASDVGGTSELIAKKHREGVLVQPHPVSIAEKLGEALEEGGLVAAPSFNNKTNLGEWINFHSNLSVILDNEGWPPEGLRDDEEASGPEEGPQRPVTSVCLVLKDDPERLERTVDVLLKEADSAVEVVLVDDGSNAKRAKNWARKAEGAFKKLGWSVYRRPHFGLAAARNFAARKARGDCLLFLDPQAHPRRGLIARLSDVAARRSADVLLPFFERCESTGYGIGRSNGEAVMFLAGDAASTFYAPQWRSPAVYIRTETFWELQGFKTDYKIPGSVEELLAAAILENKRVESVPEILVDQITDYEEIERYDEDAACIRMVRPYIRNAPLCYQPLLMAARSQGLGQTGRQFTAQHARGAAVQGSRSRSVVERALRRGREAERSSPDALKPVFQTARVIVRTGRRAGRVGSWVRWLPRRISFGFSNAPRSVRRWGKSTYRRMPAGLQRFLRMGQRTGRSDR